MDVFRCPVCDSTEGETVCRCADYRVTRETFDIIRCKSCFYAQTFPQPDEQAMEKYYETNAYISHSETSEGIVNKLYHFIRQINVRKKLHWIEPMAHPSKTLLDVGCGTGFFLEHCKKQGWNVTGVEPNGPARKKAEERINAPVYSSIDSVSVAGKTFDVITLWHVFEHLYDINRSFEQLKSLLNPHGTLVLALPNPCSKDAEIYGKDWAAFDVPRHLSHFSPQSIRLLAGKHGMQVKKHIPLKFDAYYISILSEQNRRKKGIASLLRGICQGFKSNISARKSGDYSSLVYVTVS